MQFKLYLDDKNNFEVEFDWDLSKLKDNDKLTKLHTFARGLAALQNGKIIDFVNTRLSEYATVSGKQNEGAVAITNLDRYLKADKTPLPADDDQPIFTALETFNY